MPMQIKPLAIDTKTLRNLSERLIVSHHENNDAGALKRLNAIRAQLDAVDWSTAPVFAVNGPKREELVAANSVWLHELYFDGLGGSGVLPTGTTAPPLRPTLWPGAASRRLRPLHRLRKPSRSSTCAATRALRPAPTWWSAPPGATRRSWIAGAPNSMPDDRCWCTASQGWTSDARRHQRVAVSWPGDSREVGLK